MCLPTGFCKSLCYQALPFIFDRKYDPSGAVNCVIVFSPWLLCCSDGGSSGVPEEERCAGSGGSRDTIAKEFLASESALKSASIIFCSPREVLKQMCGEKESFLHTGTSSRLGILSSHFCLLEIWLNRESTRLEGTDSWQSRHNTS